MSEKRTILVIEDEHAISNFICRALSASDYKPLAAASGKEGLSLFTARIWCCWTWGCLTWMGWRYSPSCGGCPVRSR